MKCETYENVAGDGVLYDPAITDIILLFVSLYHPIFGFSHHCVPHVIVRHCADVSMFVDALMKKKTNTKNEATTTALTSARQSVARQWRCSWHRRGSCRG